MWNDGAPPAGGPVPTPPATGQSSEETTDSAASGRFADLEETLSGLEHRPVSEHAEVYDRAHVELREALSEIDGA